MAKSPSAEQTAHVRAAFLYDPLTGDIRWRKANKSGNPARRREAGDIAGAIKSGYRRVNVAGRDYEAHRVAWMLHYGEWPALQIDHINMNRSDNRIANLRQATVSDNRCNVGPRANNTSGIKGVWRDRCGRYYADIMKDRRRLRFGPFSTAIEAGAAYAEAAKQLHGEFARLQACG